MLDKLNKIKLNDIVYVSDEVSLKENNTVEKIASTVHTLADFNIPKENIRYKIITLVNVKDNTLSYLVLNGNEAGIEVGLYFPVDLFPQGSNRKDIIDSQNEWLFKAPKENVCADVYKPSELEFTDKIEVGDVTYNQKFPVIYGEYKENYRIDPLFCALTKYQSINDIPNKDVLLFEVGGMDQNKNLLDNGGSVYLMHGRQLADNDLEILLK